MSAWVSVGLLPIDGAHYSWRGPERWVVLPFAVPLSW